jgi:hypothetical protein
VFKAICAGFKDSPDICKGDNVFEIVNSGEDGFVGAKKSSSIKVYHVIVAVLLVVILNCGALCVYRKYQKKKMNEELQLQVNSAVSQYFKLSGQDVSI